MTNYHDATSSSQYHPSRRLIDGGQRTIALRLPHPRVEIILIILIDGDEVASTLVMMLDEYAVSYCNFILVSPYCSYAQRESRLSSLSFPVAMYIVPFSSVIPFAFESPHAEHLQRCSHYSSLLFSCTLQSCISSVHQMARHLWLGSTLAIQKNHPRFHVHAARSYV